MALNIRNSEAEKLAEAVAKLTGETKTRPAELMVIDTSALLAILLDEPERRSPS